MKLIETFQDLQNETCEVHADHLGNFYVGRRGSTMMNLGLDQLEKVFSVCKKQEDKNDMESDV
jgi:hypothetical protein